MSDPNKTFTVAVASGKGGTGKTLVAANLAVALARGGRDVVLVDCDVEAPNDHLFFQVEAQPRAVMVPLAQVDEDECTACGACRDACAYGAIRILGGRTLVFPELCHGCGACTLACPISAMGETSRRVGEVSSGRAVGVADFGELTLVSGSLDVGDVKAPDVIRAARSAAGTHEIAVLDAPPGVSCAAVASVNDADLLLLVTEPTPFGLHDLELAVRLGQELGVPSAVILNRAGSGTVDIEAWCAGEGVPVLARIPFMREIAECYADARLVADEVAECAQAIEAVADFVTRGGAVA